MLSECYMTRHFKAFGQDDPEAYKECELAEAALEAIIVKRLSSKRGK